MSQLSRNEILKVWCEDVVGRSSKLGELTFPHHSHPRLSISNYKTKRNISDDLWNKFVANMEKIESDELDSKIDMYKKHNTFVDWISDIHDASYNKITQDASYNKITQDEFYSHMDKWLAKDRVAKLRMIDLAYLLNYDDCTEVDYASTFVSTLMKNKPMVDVEVDSNIRMLIPHIDMLISQNHVFYIASSQNIELCD